MYVEVVCGSPFGLLSLARLRIPGGQPPDPRQCSEPGPGQPFGRLSLATNL
jgi:hypothetical protein